MTVSSPNAIGLIKHKDEFEIPMTGQDVHVFVVNRQNLIFVDEILLTDNFVLGRKYRNRHGDRVHIYKKQYQICSME